MCCATCHLSQTSVLDGQGQTGWSVRTLNQWDGSSGFMSLKGRGNLVGLSSELVLV